MWCGKLHPTLIYFLGCDTTPRSQSIGPVFLMRSWNISTTKRLYSNFSNSSRLTTLQFMMDDSFRHDGSRRWHKTVHRWLALLFCLRESTRLTIIDEGAG